MGYLGKSKAVQLSGLVIGSACTYPLRSKRGGTQQKKKAARYIVQSPETDPATDLQSDKSMRVPGLLETTSTNN